MIQRDDRSTIFDERRVTTLSGQVSCPAGDTRFVRVDLLPRRTAGSDVAQVTCTGDLQTFQGTVQTNGAEP